MERSDWLKVKAAGGETAVCAGAGVAMIFAVLFAGGTLSHAIFSGFVVFVALGAVSLWARFASGGTSMTDIARSIGLALLVLFIAVFVLAIFFDRENVARCSIYGGLAAFIVMMIAAAREKSRR